jgi:ElaB/YqjD/DUF883 family membrane-anchored ribosome-binding protein
MAIRNHARQYADQARDMASHAYGHARDMASTAYDRSAEAMEYAADKSSEFIREFPVSTVLVAFGVGVSVGFLLSKMRS